MEVTSAGVTVLPLSVTDALSVQPPRPTSRNAGSAHAQTQMGGVFSCFGPGMGKAQEQHEGPVSGSTLAHRNNMQLST